MNEQAQLVRVLILEAEENLRHFLAQLLDRTEGFVCVGHAPGVEDIERLVTSLRPQVLLVDRAGASAISRQTLLRLRQNQPGLIVLLMDLEEGPGYERLAKRAGADGFLCKARVPETLALLRSRLRGGKTSEAAGG